MHWIQAALLHKEQRKTFVGGQQIVLLKIKLEDMNANPNPSAGGMKVQEVLCQGKICAPDLCRPHIKVSLGQSEA